MDAQGGGGLSAAQVDGIVELLALEHAVGSVDDSARTARAEVRSRRTARSHAEPVLGADLLARVYARARVLAEEPTDRAAREK